MADTSTTRRPALQRSPYVHGGGLLYAHAQDDVLRQLEQFYNSATTWSPTCASGWPPTSNGLTQYNCTNLARITCGQVNQVLTINLGGCGITGTLVGKLFEALQGFTTSIDLSQNELSGSLPELISGGALQTLDLHKNRLTGTLPLSWQSVTSLQMIDLSNNNFAGVLPESWWNLASLKELRLSSLGNVAGLIPPVWIKMSAIEVLDVSSNKLDGDLPPDWGNPAPGMPTLKELYAGGNDLGGPLWGRLVGLLATAETRASEQQV